MKFFQKRSVAALVMVLAIAAGLFLAHSRKPDGGGPVLDSGIYYVPDGALRYVLHNADGALSEETVRYIEAMNASLFDQTGAEIVLDVVETTGSQDIADYADELFMRYGIGSRERDNGILLVLALRNLYNGAPDGDYYINWGSGFSSALTQQIENIPYDYLEADFSAKRYDAGVRKTFDALVDCMEAFYGVTVQEGYSGGAKDHPTGSSTYSYAAASPDAAFILGNIIGLLLLLFFVWILLDAFRYRHYRRRFYGRPSPPVYYPVFWGRPRRPRRPPPPPPPPGFGGAGPRPSGGFHSGGSLGGGAGRRPSGGFHSGGSLGGGAGRRPSGGSSGGGAGRRPSGGAGRSSGGFHRGGSLGGGARRGGGGSRPSGGGRRR